MSPACSRRGAARARPRRRAARAPRAVALASALLGAGVGPGARSARADDLTLSVTPPALRLGEDRGAELALRGPDVPASELELLATAGVVRGLTRVGPGRFSARYEPPEGRAPDVAVLFARVRGGDARGAAAVATVPLAGRYHLALDAEPGTRLTVRAGDEPPRVAVAAAGGGAAVVLHVAPGVHRASILAEDRAGNRVERTEAIEVPPAHRILVLAASPPAGEPRTLRWLVAAATASGAPAERPPDVALEGAAFRVTAVTPGLFEVVARPPRRVVDVVVTLRASAAGAAAVEPATAVGRAVIPRTIEVNPDGGAISGVGAVRARAGEPLELPVVVRDDEGEAIDGLQDALAASVGGDPAARVEARGEGYVVVGRAPERAGSAEVLVRLRGVGSGGELEARGAVAVDAGPAARVEVRVPTLRVGSEAVLGLAPLDRYGNRATLGHPVLRAAGASVRAATATEAGLRVVLVPRASLVRLSLRGDYDFAETLTLPATVTRRAFALGALATARSNFGALGLVGLRARVEGLAAFAEGWDGYGAVEAGAEYAGAGDGRGAAANLVTVPLFLRLGFVRHQGAVGAGPLLGVGVRPVIAMVRNESGEVLRQSATTFAFSAAFQVRFATPGGTVSVEAGWELGEVALAVARGSVGGVYAALGWSWGL